MAKIKSIYDNPYKYAYECDVPIELARIACKKQRRFNKLVHRARKCPECNSRALRYDCGSWWHEGIGDSLYCEKCGSEYEIEEIENGNLLIAMAGFDFIVYYSLPKKIEWRMEARAEELGVNTLEEWHSWAWREVRRS